MIEIRILGPAHEYIQRQLKDSEKGILKADIEAIQSGDFESVHVKKLRGKIYELIFGSHRITYFQRNGKLYLVRGFRKTSNKTPKREIEYAQKIYKTIKK